MDDIELMKKMEKIQCIFDDYAESGIVIEVKLDDRPEQLKVAMPLLEPGPTVPSEGARINFTIATEISKLEEKKGERVKSVSTHKSKDGRTPIFLQLEGLDVYELNILSICKMSLDEWVSTCTKDIDSVGA